MYRSYRVQNRMIRFAKNSNVVGHVLMFHHVTDEYVDIMPECKCKIGEFERILDNYERAGFKFVGIDSAVGLLGNKKTEKFVIVTFDDIPDDVYTNAYPILKKRHIPFTIFVAPGLVDTGDYITDNHLSVMAKDTLCTVGAHTMNHPNLSKIKDCNWEILQSKLVLEESLKRPVKYFAYPYGSLTAVPRRARIAAQKAGFELAFCTISAPVSTKSLTDSFFIPRIVPESNQIGTFSRKSIVRDAFNYFKKKVK